MDFRRVNIIYEYDGYCLCVGDLADPKEDAEKIDQINYSFALIENGKATGAHWQGIQTVSAYLRRNPHITGVLAVGGWGADGFSSAVATPETRDKLADSAVRVLEELDLNGLDWDWEYPGSDMAGIACAKDDPVNMSAFLVLLRQKMDRLSERTGKKYELSIAAGANRIHDYLWDQVEPVLDSVNLMTYDMVTEGQVAHVSNLRKCSHASYSVEQSVADFTAAGVPREKLLIGGTMYFHRYLGADAAAPFGKPYREKGHPVSHDAVGEDYAHLWDEEARAGYFVKGDELLSGDDVRSMDAKRAYIEAENLAGIILWELNEDSANVLLPHIGNR